MKISSNIVFVRFEGLRLLDLVSDANLNLDIQKVARRTFDKSLMNSRVCVTCFIK